MLLRMTLRLTFIFVITLAVSACSESSGGFTTPESAAKAFMQATADGDEYALKLLTSSNAPSPAYNIAEVEEPAPTEEIKSFRILSTDDHESFATVDVDVELKDGSSRLRRILLVKTDKGWFVSRSAWVAEPATGD